MDASAVSAGRHKRQHSKNSSSRPPPASSVLRSPAATRPPTHACQASRPPDLIWTRQECNLLVGYVRSLPVPIAVKADGDKDNAQIKAGEATFKAIGCTHCHLPKLGDVEGIYSDLLLHDMGSQLADADTYTVFSGEPPRADRAGLVDRARGGHRRRIRP